MSSAELPSEQHLSNDTQRERVQCLLECLPDMKRGLHILVTTRTCQAIVDGVRVIAATSLDHCLAVGPARDVANRSPMNPTRNQVCKPKAAIELVSAARIWAVCLL